jgi:hypothetical protein
MISKRKSSATFKAGSEKLTSESIQEQTRAFLQSGGKIQHIGHGVSGQSNIPGRKHIILANQTIK